jgi:DNA-binding NtrC family response regulator
VDDEEVIRNLLCNELADAGYAVSSLGDGQEAMSGLRANKFDLVLLDIKMPNVDGIEVLKFIHKNFPTVKVIMITGFATLKHAMEAKEFGAVDFITKPFNMADVLSTITRVIGK